MGYHNLRFYNNVELWGEDNTSDQLNKIQNEIYELTDKLEDGSLNSENDKMDIEWTLNKEFSDYLKKYPDIAKTLYEAISKLNFDNIMNVDIKNANERAKQNLLIFLEPLVNGITITDSIWTLNNVEWNFYEKNFDKKSEIKPDFIMGKVKKILESLWNKVDWEDENKDNFRVILNNVKQVMEHPNPDNTKLLQIFILKNLDWKDREKLLKGSFKGENETNPDWLFGQATLDWVDAFLTKMDKYIDKLSKAEDVMSENKLAGESEVEAWHNSIKPVSDLITFEKWSAYKLEDWLANLPKWAKVDFATDEEKAKMDNDWEKTIKLQIILPDFPDKPQFLEVKVNIITNTAAVESTWDWSADAAHEKPTGTEPITVWEGQHLVMSNSNQLASKYNLDWATFYSASAFNWAKAEWGQAEWEQTQPQLAENTEMEDWEYVYYVKFNGMPNTYKIRVNEQWGLFPLTTEYNSFADWLETRALIKNNECCVNYLNDKLWISWISIQRNGGINDYTIRSFWKELTIEPMTMDKKWVSEDLRVCLRLLNLTNYLTSWVNEELKWTDPNLRVRGDKLQVQTVKWWKNISDETMRIFWLAWVDEWDMKRFIKYNNHEDWNDNWDRKKPNRIYKKLDISWRAQVLWWSQSGSQIVDRWFSIGSAKVWGWANVKKSQLEGVPTSDEVKWEVLEQSVLNGLLSWIKFDEIWTMRSSWYWYQMFEFNDVKTEWAKEWDASWNTESGNESNDEGGNNYIEIWWHKFMEATDNFTGLWYKVTKHWVYVWEFKDGQKNWIWVDVPSINNLIRPVYIWSFEKWLYNWNWKLELDWNSYEWEFKDWLWVWEWEFTWLNWNKYKWTFDNPLGEGRLSFSINNNNGSVVRLVTNEDNGKKMAVDKFFIGEMKEWTLTVEWKDYHVVDGKYTTDNWEVKEIPHP